MSTSSTYAVGGMTCGHCVTAVTEELARVREAVDEAGYQLASGPS